VTDSPSILRRFEVGYSYSESTAGLSVGRYVLIRLSDSVVLARCKTRGPLERMACPVWDGMPDPNLAIMRR
jgi:hypothetical protein